MRSRWIIVLVISLLSGCAFIDGLHNQQDQAPAAPTTQGETVAAPGAIGPSPVNNQNNAETNAAKMITPLVQ